MEGICTGDVVVGLFGTSLPFVLRPINSKQEYEMVNFAFVADHDYVHTGLESAPEGTPFGCLESGELHPWISLIFASLRAATYRAVLRFYPALSWLTSLTIPKRVMQQYAQHWKFSLDEVNRRLEKEQDRPDFISMIKLDEAGVKGITLPELHATASVLIIAGSETTTTVLSGTVNYLVKTLEKLTILTDEVRSSFKTESDVALSALKDLPYLGAVVQEGLRLCKPTPVGTPHITPPGGGSVAGNWLLGGTFINVHPLALSSSPAMFHEPEFFIPERWLGTDPAFANDRHDAVQAFGVGPRSCIGKSLALAELRLILARLIWRFDMYQADTEVGRLIWRSQRTFSVVERRPLQVVLRVREDMSHDSQ